MKKIGLLALMMMAPLALMAETICAVVKIEIRQEVSFERQAFDAKMVITNGLEDIDLRDLGINVIFRDTDGNPVVASSNPDSSGAKFFITVDRIEGVENATGGLVFPEDANGILSDATAVIPAGARAEIHWLIIPTADAVADGNKMGEMYGVGANVSYTYGEESQTVEVAPDYIEVRPTPSLELDYFLPADVFADDPLTASVEPVEPFDLGLRIKNNGDGEAINLKIESAQPKITENDQGLLIDFLLLGTSVNDQPVIPSLLADIGDLASEENAMVSWKMSTSLSGEFVSFTADFIHSDDLGGELTSLIESPIDTHILLHKVKVDEVGRDNVTDFLAYDQDILRVYESDGQDQTVSELNPVVIDNGIINQRKQFTLTLPSFSGPGFAQWTDVYYGAPQLMTVIRNSDQKVLPSENIWQYKEQGNPGEYFYYMGVFDSNGGGDYTLIVDGLAPNIPPVVIVQSPQQGFVDQAMSFNILVTDADATDVLTLTPINMPSGSGLTETSPGNWQFNWMPTAGDEGNQNVQLRASDGTVEVDVIIQLVISQQDPDDTDGDGLLDAWEQEHFGDLDEDGAGDFDQDGATNLQEHDHGGDPTVEDRPQAVVVESPNAGAQIAIAPADFMIVNSEGAVDATMVYEFEIYENSLQNLFFSETIDESELSTTSWVHGQSFAEDIAYIWRVRAFDGATYSTWSYDEFFFSTNNDAPQFCALDYPDNGLVIIDLVLELSVNQAIDTDSDSLQYRFEVFEDAEHAVLLADSGWLNQGEQLIRSWQPYLEYEFDTSYYWTAKVSDGNSEVLCVDSQFSTGINIPAQNGYQLNAPSNDALTAIDLDLVVDAPVNVLIEFEIDVQPDFNSAQLLQNSILTDGSGQAIWQLSGLDHSTVYFWRARGIEGAVTRYGRWQYGQFTSQGVNGAPVLKMVNPADQSWVTSRTPELQFSIDQYAGFADTFQVDIYQDADATVLFNSQVIDSQTVLVPELTDRSRFYWQAKGLHADGSETPFTPLNRFFVIDDLVDDVPVFEFVSLQQATSTAGSSFRIEWMDGDEDSNATIDLYYDLDNSGADGMVIATGLSEDAVDHYDWDISSLIGETVYLYAEISDGSSTIVNYSLDTLRIDESLIEVLAGNNSVSEVGDQAVVNIALVQQPEDYVVIPVAVSDDSEITVDVDELFFDLNNWSMPQTITVTGVDDALVDGDQIAYVQFGPIQSADVEFAATQIADLEMTNVDDDIPGVLFTAVAGTSTSETGDVVSFEVTLLTEPQADVTLDLVSSDESEGVVSPLQLTFTSANWDIPQTVEVTGQDDSVVDDDVAYEINTTISSADVDYEGLAIVPLNLTNIDDDLAGVNVNITTGGDFTTEAGGTVVLEVSLNSEPLNDVSIALLSSNEAEGVVETTSLLFTAANWDQVQTVTVTGQDDLLVDGDISYAVSLTSSSADTEYEGIGINDINLINIDDDAIGVIIAAQGALQTTEAGGTVDVSISLSAEPEADVTMSFVSSNTTEAEVGPTTLVFSTADWNTPQFITLIGQDDQIVDGDQAYQIDVVVSSADGSYDGLTVPAIAGVNVDDDVVGVVVSPTDNLVTTEQGGTATFSVVLSSEPEASVSIDFSSSDSSEGDVNSLLVFTAANWNLPQNVVVTGVDDSESDGDISYTISGIVSSVDENYDGYNVNVVGVLNIDDDVAGIRINAMTDLVTNEAGNLQALFWISLFIEPTDDVILDFSVSDSSEGQITNNQMVFTSKNWSQSQVLTVDGVNDDLIDYDVAYDVNHMITSTDAAYAALTPEVINLINLDDDVPQQNDVYYTGEDSHSAEAACNAAAAAVSEPDRACVPSEIGAEHPHWSYDGLLRWPETNGVDYHATYYYGIDCPVGSSLDASKGCVNEDDQGLQTMSPVGEGGGTVLANSINVATGNHYHYEPIVDLSAGLTFGISYNSHAMVDAFGDPVSGGTGLRWTHDYNRSVSAIYQIAGNDAVDIIRADGRIVTYTNTNNTAWVSNSHVKSNLLQTSKGWTYQSKNGDVEFYNKLGQLVEIHLHSGEYLTLIHSLDSLRVTNEFGQYIDINYQLIDSALRINNVTDHMNRYWGFIYAADNLSFINYPTVQLMIRKQFHYENVAIPGLLTGISDQQGVRFSSYAHDLKGRIIFSELANGVNRIDLAYLGDTNRTLTNSLGSVSLIEVEKPDHLWRLKSFSGPGCSACDVGNETFVYDVNNNLISHIKDGVTTTYGGYDNKGQYAFKIEADEPGVGADERRADYTYDSRFIGKITSITEPSIWTNQSKVNTYTYNSRGQKEVTITSGYQPNGSPVSRANVHAYMGPFNQISQIDGPLPGLADQTVYQYYPNSNSVITRRNRLKRITGPEGIVERDNIRWSGTGKVTEEQRPNGITINHVYDAQSDRLLSTTHSDGSNSQVIQYTYLRSGQVSSITQNYGTSAATSFDLTYDEALRLISIKDEVGSTVNYTLDSEGNVLSEKTYGINGSRLPARVINQTFDAYGHLASWQQSGVTVTYDHNSNGLLNSQTNGRGVTTDYSYDSMKRLTQKIQDYQGTDPSTADIHTSFSLDEGSRVKTITDARGNTTTHEYDDFGNLIILVSPDSGSSNHVYDEVGNITAKTDGNGSTVNMTYDSRDRLTAIDYADDNLDTTFSYDQGVNGMNQLTSFTDHSGYTDFSYDAFGNLLSKSQAVHGFNDIEYAGFNDLTISYTYDAYNRVTTMSYPSGMTLSYQYDELNQVNKITTTISTSIFSDSLIDVVDSITYLPFGSVQSMNFGNGQNYNAVYDNGYRLSGYSYGSGVIASLSYDNNHNITFINREIVTDNDWFAYDNLDRLAQENHLDTQYSYDQVGNRTLKQENDESVQTINTDYTIDNNSNRLMAINFGTNRLYDANGNTLRMTITGNKEWVYNQANRMSMHTQDGITRGVYYYNAMGERVQKTHNKTNGSLAGEFLYMYDEKGRLVHVSKYKNGQHIWDRENVYLGNRIIAQIRKTYSGSSMTSNDIFYIQTDHMLAPRWVTNDSGQRIWSLESDAFGTTQPVIDVDDDGSNFHFYLRGSNQYYDGESGMHHNYQRDYDPSTGRYLQSSPVGLGTHINSYDFSNGSPINNSDRTGAGVDVSASCYSLIDVFEGDCRYRHSSSFNIKEALEVVKSIQK